VKLGKALGMNMDITGRAALVAVIVLAVVNALIRPVFKLLTLPLNCLTFGIVGVLINAMMFWIAGKLVDGFEINGVVPALFGSVVVGIVSGILNRFVKRGNER